MEKIVPVLAQQSLRELDLKGRTYQDVIDGATWAVFNTGYEGDWATDGDHLKDADAVISALKQGCTMITADLSDYLSFKFMDADIQTVSREYSKIDPVLRESIEARYRGTITLSSNTELFYNEQLLQRIALNYNRALDHAVKLYQACGSSHRRRFGLQNIHPFIQRQVLGISDYRPACSGSLSPENLRDELAGRSGDIVPGESDFLQEHF